MPRITIKRLVEEDLGYCCLWFFLTRFRKSRQVADRLGVDIRTVNYARNKVSSGEEKCRECANCMDKVVTMKLAPRKTRSED